MDIKSIEQAKLVLAITPNLEPTIIGCSMPLVPVLFPALPVNNACEIQDPKGCMGINHRDEPGVYLLTGTYSYSHLTCTRVFVIEEAVTMGIDVVIKAHPLQVEYEVRV